ncbi:hypothetical protein QFC22_003000 [Naganishia vaughanmartiniae]|uniref:Uncharacterized protein n=1 Tax=Naganishia vaughanmartiniae TaxID=1424756 RepID=A0ACC2X9Y0_9TREE|nr:hypothetical protein QFC22_003000 [Naganishia vaughanmartiniae]
MSLPTSPAAVEVTPATAASSSISETHPANDIKDTEETPAERRERLHTAPFGSRFLTDEADVFSHNAWDHVTPPPEWEDDAKRVLDMQRQAQVSKEMKWAYNNNPAMYWHRFYNINKANFFKDRNWLRLEFQELLDCAKADAGPKTIVEVGCGAGNTVFPLLAKNENPHLVVHACDYAASAVEVVKSNPMYPVPPHGKGILHSSVWDVTTPPVAAQSTLSGAHAQTPVNATTAGAEGENAGEARESAAATSLPEGVQPGTVDIAIMIFVLSALHPLEWQRAIANVYKMLKPGGMVFIRDYGRYDLAQLRIKKGRMLDENFYIRGDGTRVYFFDAAELSEMLTGSKTAYEPVQVDQQAPTTVEVENEDGSVTVSHTPAEGEEVVSEVDTGLEGKLAALTTKDEPAVPLSTRFRPPGSTVPEPRIEFHAHSTPTLTNDANTEKMTAVDAEGESHLPIADEGTASLLDPFAGAHADLGIPDHPLFKIDQLGVDRRMLVNRKKQLRMYRIWMQVKARKLVPGEDAQVEQ